MFSIVFATQFSLCANSDQTAEIAFTNIYDDRSWGANELGEGCSGPGSTISSTEIYRKFLQDFLVTYNIQSVVDAGCGDWEFSRLINWEGINYKGFDVVKSVIEKNQKKYANSNIQFFKENLTIFDLPAADLLICKDVLQHLPNEDIMSFIQQFPKFKYCLITNDVDCFGTSDNSQISYGGHRPLDLTQSPFLVVGDKILTFISPGCTKQVLFIQNLLD